MTAAVGFFFLGQRPRLGGEVAVGAGSLSVTVYYYYY